MTRAYHPPRRGQNRSSALSYPLKKLREFHAQSAGQLEQRLQGDVALGALDAAKAASRGLAEKRRRLLFGRVSRLRRYALFGNGAAGLFR